MLELHVHVRLRLLLWLVVRLHRCVPEELSCTGGVARSAVGVVRSAVEVARRARRIPRRRRRGGAELVVQLVVRHGERLKGAGGGPVLLHGHVVRLRRIRQRRTCSGVRCAHLPSELKLPQGRGHETGGGQVVEVGAGLRQVVGVGGAAANHWEDVGGRRSGGADVRDLDALVRQRGCCCAAGSWCCVG